MSEYRGDIQIYRALAVTIVILFHMGAPGFGSGFLGVDIFFVISGYLMQKLHRDDSSALSFYRRRARRLLPAYFATVAVTLLAAYFVTLPMDYSQAAGQAAAAAIFMSNVGFWFQNSYFSKDLFNPLLHLWSLAVEVQFYLLFPVLAWITRGRPRFLAAITLASLALCVVLLLVSPKTSFFMMPTRLWQFTLGMLAATWTGKANRRIGLAAFAGMVAIPFVPIAVDATSFISGHPGLAALAVSAATALALAHRLDDRLTGSGAGRIGQRVGNISYSLYLAHWPVLVLINYQPFAGTVTSGGGALITLMSVALIVAATALLYLCFERPGPRIYTGWRSVGVAVTIAAVAIVTPAMQARLFSTDQQRIFAGADDRAVYRCGKLFRIENPTETLCPIGEGPSVAFLIGDSHSDSLKRTFADVAEKEGYATYFAVDNEPLLTSGLDSNWLAREARRHKADRVYIHFSPGNLDAETVVDTAARLRAEGIQTALIAPVPTFSDNVLESLYNHSANRSQLTNVSRDDYDQANRHKLALIAKAGVPVIETASTLCTPICRMVTPDGEPAYFDDGHMTLSGAEMLEEVLESGFEGVHAVSNEKSAGPA